jgi:TfoX/Sxy family transcriptional regulator of competence genes
VDDLAEQIRAFIGDDPNVVEIRMFGGTCFTLNGNMMVGTMKDGSLLVRVGEDQEAAALALPGATRMNFTGREMKGFIMVAPDELDEEAIEGGSPWHRDLSGRCRRKNPQRNELRCCDHACRPETIHTLSAETSKVARAIICALRFALV